ncbi:MAG: hypothetical protein WC477_07285 [Patescibacteria group bacterium]
MNFDPATIIQTVILIAGGTVGTWLFTELAKRAKSIPWVQPGNAVRLRATAGVFSVIGTLLAGFADKGVMPDDLQGAVVSILSCVAMWVGSHAIHEVTKEK